MRRGKVVVSGPMVQDVGHRLFLLNLASESNLTGFQARNVGGDRVEALYEGGEQECEEFVKAVRRLAPEEAEVSGIEFKEYEGPVKRIEVFRNEFVTIQLGRIVEVGVEMLGKQDRMLEKQDTTIEKVGALGVKVDAVGAKIDSLGEKVDTVGVKVEKLGVKIDTVGEKIDNLGEKVDAAGAKVEALGAKVDGLREDLRSMLDRRLTDLERDMALVKERLGIRNTRL